MATVFTSVQVNKEKEAAWDVLKGECEARHVPFNALFNAMISGLIGAVKTYDPKTKTVRINLGPIKVK